MRLTLEELGDLLLVAEDGHTETVDLGGGRSLELRGATPAEYLRCVVRRVPAERAKFLDSVREGVEQGKAEAEGKEPAADKGPDDFDFVGYVEARLDSGLEGMAALVAACAGFGGNEGAEAMFVRHPKLTDLHAVADRLTHGTTTESREAFSEAVGALIWGAPTKTTPAPSSPASEAAEQAPAPAARS